MDTTNPYTIFICMYKINTECVKPFLEFLLDISPEKASLPRIDEFKCSTNVQLGGENQDQYNTPEHTNFMNECLNKLLNIIPIHNTINPL